MKSISVQYQELKEGRMTQHQFLRNARMMFPNFVTNHNSFDDSVKILKNRGLLNEGDAVKGVPDKAPTYDYPTQPGKYMKVIQEPEVDEQDGIYPATTVTDIPKEEVSKSIKSKNRPDGLEPIKPHDTKNEMKKIRIVKESKKNLTEATVNEDISSDAQAFIDMIEKNPALKSRLEKISNPQEIEDIASKLFAKIDPEVLKDMPGVKSAVIKGISKIAGISGKEEFRPKVDLGKSSEKFLSQFRSVGASGPGQSFNKLKEAVKALVSKMLDEYEVGDESDEAPSIPGVISIIVDDAINRIESNDIDLGFTSKEIGEILDNFQDKIGHRYSEEQFDAIIDGAIEVLKKKGYNITT